MYLFHNTAYPMEIFKSTYILPSSITLNVNETPNEMNLPYIFMNCSNDVEGMIYIPSYTFVFPIDILYDREFYTCNSWNAGNTNNCLYHTKNTLLNIIYRDLCKLWKQSIKTDKDVKKYGKKEWKSSPNYPLFRIYQEIFFKKYLSVYDATHYIISRTVLEEQKKHIDYIQFHYPHLKIIINEPTFNVV